jgi:DNA-binding NarL/FixJ family response regulator
MSATPSDPSGFARRVLIVEDDGLLAELIGSHLLGAGFAVAIATGAAAALETFDAFDPDVALLDIDLGSGPTGVDLAHILVERAPYLALVFLTKVADSRFAGRELPEGVPIAYLRKRQVRAPADVVAAIDAALGERDAPEMRHDITGMDHLVGLSQAQFEVLRMIAEGRSNAEIAAARGTTERAVEHLIRRTLHAAGIAGDAGGSRRVLAARLYIDAAGAVPPPRDG